VYEGCEENTHPLSDSPVGVTTELAEVEQSVWSFFHKLRCDGTQLATLFQVSTM